MREGDEPVTKTDRSSLRLLGSVGEPINPEAWMWYHNVVGEERCPIVDTWWQTETGGIMITPLPGATATKPGSATRPFFGIAPVLVDNDNNVIEGAVDGSLCIDRSWPGQMRTVYKDHERFIQTYFTTFLVVISPVMVAVRTKMVTTDYSRVDDVLMFLVTVWVLLKLSQHLWRMQKLRICSCRLPA